MVTGKLSAQPKEEASRSVKSPEEALCLEQMNRVGGDKARKVMKGRQRLATMFP